jgi:diketogulonate reductase-like aldo/keto reductase
MRITRLPGGEPVPVLGQGTWRMGERATTRETEIAALQLGLELGLTLIDTAEMYADGGAEEVVGAAIAGRRDDVFLISKVLPEHATAEGTVAACERSLQRLKTDRLDLYLLHWREDVPLKETVEGFEALIRMGKIRYWGVSNLDVADMEDLVNLAGGSAVATDQVLYNLTRRRIEWNLLPWCQGREIPIMAYSPIEQARMLKHPTLKKVAARHGATPAQVALAWVLRQDLMITIPKAGTVDHVRQNRAALDIHLAPDDIAILDRAFPPPDGPGSLETL